MTNKELARKLRELNKTMGLAKSERRELAYQALDEAFMDNRIKDGVGDIKKHMRGLDFYTCPEGWEQTKRLLDYEEPKI